MKRERYYNVFQFGEIANEMMTSVLKERKIYDKRLIINWSFIVGDDFSTLMPLFLTYNNNGRILYVGTKEMRFVAHFPYIKNNIIEKVNLYFGYTDKERIVDAKLKMLI
ncbi:MAG: hypothetical protein RL208_373 [Pseudomonadota bacterium]|jgi:hypothetical protein